MKKKLDIKQQQQQKMDFICTSSLPIKFFYLFLLLYHLNGIINKLYKRVIMIIIDVIIIVVGRNIHAS